MKKCIKSVIILSICLFVFVLTSVVLYAIDKNRAEKDESPLFSLSKTNVNDGGTVIYYGLGYQIIVYQRLNSQYPAGTYDCGVEYHYLFGFNSTNEPEIELTPKKID